MTFKGAFQHKPFYDSMILLRMLLINVPPHSTFSEMKTTPPRKQLFLGLWGLMVFREDVGFRGHGEGGGEYVKAHAVSPRRSRMVNTHKLIARQREMHGDRRLLS